MGVTMEANYTNPATPEEIWAILRRTTQLHEETEERWSKWQKEEAERRKEADERWQQELAEMRKEAEERWKEIEIETKKTQKIVSDLGNSIGELVEILIAAHLWEKFPEYDLKMAYRRLPIYNEKKEAKTEIDILLVDSKWAMIVEVKRNLDDINDIDHHLKRMDIILQYPPALIPPQAKILGAMAAGVVTPEAAAYAHECGFFVLELSGETVVRIPSPPGFVPKVF